MGCNCGKPKCDGHCGVSPAVLQINNPSECTLFHRVEVPASMGDSKTNPPKNGAYKNVLLFYEADQTSWLYSSDGIPQKLVNGLTNYEDAINLPKINGVTLIGDKSLDDLGITDAIDDAVAEERAEREAVDEAMQDELSSLAVVFDTVADMKAATNLADGVRVETLGYRTVDDNGAAFFVIKNTGTADGKSVIALDGGLYAHMVYKHDFVTPEMFGAYGDGVNDHNDSDAIQFAINTGKTVEFAPKTYMCYSLTINSPTVLHGNGATLKRPELDIAPYSLTVAQMKWIKTITVSANCVLKDIIFDNNCFTMWQPSDGYTQEQSCSLLVRNTTKVIELVIDKCTFKNSAGDGLHIVDNVNANITNCRSIDCFRGGLTSTGYGSEINVDNWISEVHTTGVHDGFDVEVDSASSIYPEKYILNMNNITLDYDLDIVIPEKGVGNLTNVVMRPFDENNRAGFDLGAMNGAVLNIENSQLRSGQIPAVQIYIQGGNVNLNNCDVIGNETDPVFKVSQYQPINLTHDGKLNINNCTINGYNFMSVAGIKGYINICGCEINCVGDFIVNNGNSSPAVQHLWLKNNQINFSGMFITLTKTGAIDSTVNLYLYGNSIKGGGDDFIKTWADAGIYYDSTPMEGAIRLQKGGGSTPPIFYGNNRIILVNSASDLTFAGWVAGDDIAIAKDTGARYRYTSGTTWTAL